MLYNIFYMYLFAFIIFYYIILYLCYIYFLCQVAVDYLFAVICFQLEDVWDVGSYPQRLGRTTLPICYDIL